MILASAVAASIGLLLGAVGRGTGSPVVTMFLAIVAAVSLGTCAGLGRVVDRAAALLGSASIAAVQSVVLTVAVALSGCVALPPPYVWIILFLTTLSGAFMGRILSALCGNAATALLWLPLLLVPQVIFGGLLFPYYPTQPFAIDPRTGKVEVMPRALAPPAVSSWPLQIGGALVVSRWALEAYAALVYERDLSDQTALREATAVNAWVPVLFGDDIAHPLWLHVRAQSLGEPTTAPRLRGGGVYYLLLLLVFAGVEAAALVVIQPGRDRHDVA
jgi:hypothetical protein